MSLKASIFFLNVVYLCKISDKNIFWEFCIKEDLAILNRKIEAYLKTKKNFFSKALFL